VPFFSCPFQVYIISLFFLSCFFSDTFSHSKKTTSKMAASNATYVMIPVVSNLSDMTVTGNPNMVHPFIELWVGGPNPQVSHRIAIDTLPFPLNSGAFWIQSGFLSVMDRISRGLRFIPSGTMAGFLVNLPEEPVTQQWENYLQHIFPSGELDMSEEDKAELTVDIHWLAQKGLPDMSLTEFVMSYGVSILGDGKDDDILYMSTAFKDAATGMQAYVQLESPGDLSDEPSPMETIEYRAVPGLCLFRFGVFWNASDRFFPQPDSSY
jgi:hypothetical protein